MKTIRIANAAGYWGDDPDAVRRQLAGGAVDYITLDFLAETTMSILKKQHRSEPTAGYAADFVKLVLGALPELMKNGTRVVSNAGGVNPVACAAALAVGAKAAGLSPKIALVMGDDLMEAVPGLRKLGVSFSHADSGEAFAAVAPQLVSANAYLGAAPIAAALAGGAQIVITGRVADASLTLGPCVHAFGWSWSDWDKLAAGTIAGHLLECGAQVTGGNFTDWKRVRSLANIGFPIAEVEASGAFVLTKHPGTGGLVSRETVLEQLLYEVGDPSAYLTPDVVVDMTGLTVADEGADRVRVTGARGRPATDQYKVSMAYDAGSKLAGGVIVSGPDAEAKATAYAQMLWSRCPGLEETLTEYVGRGALHGSLGARRGDEEIWLRFAARSRDAKALAKLGKLIPALILSGPPGITFTGGVPKPQEVLGFWPALCPKKHVTAKLAWYVEGAVKDEQTIPVPPGEAWKAHTGAEVAVKPSCTVAALLAERERPESRPISDWCLARSGDKGDKLNLAVIARSRAAYHFLKETLTAQRVKDWFQEVAKGPVTRYPVDGLGAMNFVLDQALGGGGMVSLRLDALGKGMGQALLRQRIAGPGEG